MKFQTLLSVRFVNLKRYSGYQHLYIDTEKRMWFKLCILKLDREKNIPDCWKTTFKLPQHQDLEVLAL